MIVFIVLLCHFCLFYIVLHWLKSLESPLDCKETQPVHPKGDQSWVFIGRTDAEAETNTLATSCDELTHLKRPWCWEGLGAGGEGDDRGWDGWVASLTRWAWVWVNSRSWWWTGRPGMLRFMGSQRVGHDWATELNWTELEGEEVKRGFFLMMVYLYVDAGGAKKKRKGKARKGKRMMEDFWAWSLSPISRGWSCRELLFWEFPGVSPGHPYRGRGGPGPVPSGGTCCISSSASASPPVLFACATLPSSLLNTEMDGATRVGKAT